MMSWYGAVLVLHIVAVISWMAGLLYLPRLYVYHSQVEPGSDTARLFKVMERKLLHAITVPAMVAAWIFGLILATQIGLAGQGWLHAKLGLVFLLTAYTAMMEKWRRDFFVGRHPRSERFFRIINEIPALLMIFIVGLVILKPF
jgi:protoporphyrinogen IX oxidase